ELALEHGARPRSGVGALLDRHDLAQVATLHRGDRQLLRRRGRQQAGEHAHGRTSRTDQLIWASGARRYTGSISFGRTQSSRRARAWASSTSAAADGWTGPDTSQW